MGKAISSDNAAYTYLPESVKAFPNGQKFADVLDACGFNRISIHPVTFGIATIYKCQKPSLA
jgi:demethylmenaquinone methyltransferase/2-methoxy-6-polyprenyl-1,4-benzoquinol methylase